MDQSRGKAFMKKILWIILPCILFLSSGCGIWKSDDSICREKMQELISVLDSADAEALHGLFAQNSLEKIDGFFVRADDLFDYYQGTSCTISQHNGLTVTDKFDHGKSSKVLNVSYTIDTDVAEYSLAVKWCVEDDFDENNVGIQYIFLLNSEHNPYPEYRYWGDGTATAGIYVNRPYAGIYLENLISCISDRDKEKFASLFSQTAILQQQDFQTNVETLFSAYDGKYDYSNSFIAEYSTESNRGYDISYYLLQYGEPVSKIDCFCLRWCTESEDPNQIGALSFSYKKADGNVSMAEPYWGDGLWTEGVHVTEVEE